MTQGSAVLSTSYTTSSPSTSFPGSSLYLEKVPWLWRGYGWSRVYTCQLQTHRGWVLNKLQLQLQLSSPSLRSYLWNLLKSSRHVTSRNTGYFLEVERGPWERGLEKYPMGPGLSTTRDSPQPRPQGHPRGTLDKCPWYRLM